MRAWRNGGLRDRLQAATSTAFRDELTEIDLMGGTPYPIPAGASDHRLGGLGFAGWVREVEQQEAELGRHEKANPGGHASKEAAPCRIHPRVARPCQVL